MPTHTFRDEADTSTIHVVFGGVGENGSYRVSDTTNFADVTSQSIMSIRRGTEFVQFSDGIIAYLEPGVYYYTLKIDDFKPHKFEGYILASLDPENNMYGIVNFNVGVDYGYYGNKVAPWVVLIASTVALFIFVYGVVAYIDGRKPNIELCGGIAYSMVSIGTTLWFLSQVPPY